MKAIISHDIDHITVSEHLLKDLIVPKYMARIHVELALGKISLREYILRWSEFFKNKWQNIDELITFNNIHHVPSSFFIGVKNGLGLSYSHEAMMVWIEQIRFRHCELGVHGISFAELDQIKEEHDLFLKYSGQTKTGMRMHYVRQNKNTLSNISKAGYTYDSTVCSFENPYKIGNMWEFPFQIMDGWVIEAGRKWQHSNLKQAKEKTKQLIDKAYANNLMYLGVDFHDRYFNSSYKTWIEWYTWLVNYLIENKVSFVNFEQAIKELEKEPSKIVLETK
jgi:hypothetical protein